MFLLERIHSFMLILEFLPTLMLPREGIINGAFIPVFFATGAWNAFISPDVAFGLSESI
jgi:hypothetical protein